MSHRQQVNWKPCENQNRKEVPIEIPSGLTKPRSDSSWNQPSVKEANRESTVAGNASITPAPLRTSTFRPLFTAAVD